MMGFLFNGVGERERDRESSILFMNKVNGIRNEEPHMSVCVCVCIFEPYLP